jgi:hypothetical protein
MGRPRKIIGTFLEIWGGVRIVVDILSSLDATKNYVHYAYIQLAAAPASRSLTITVIVVGLVLLLYEPVQRFLHLSKSETPLVEQESPHLSLEAFKGEIHAYPGEAPYFFIRNCDPTRFVLNVRFDPVESRRGLKLWLNEVTSLAPGERVPLGFRAGEDGEYPGVAGHIINFFEGGSPIIDQPPYQITARFLDGTQERTEQHTMEGTQLRKGGVRVKITPTV